MGLWYKLKSGFLSWGSDIRIYRGGIILFGSSYYNVKGEDVRKILNVIEPGDVLLRRYDHYLGSRLIAGYWSHAAIYVGEDSVIHMLGEGITKEDILTFTRCDDIAVLRCQIPSLIPEAIKNAYAYLSKEVEYDYDFDNNSDNNLYCTEYVDDIFSSPVKKCVGGDKIVLPDHFLECKVFKKMLEIYGPKK